MRGDHVQIHPLSASTLGSPPLARGPRFQSQQGDKNAGITPACAGTTLGHNQDRPPAWDHPRLRGDHRRILLVSPPLRGSPPLARGPLFLRSDVSREVRITPACAGTTRRTCRRGAECGDHPRLRGDHDFGTAQNRNRLGSPPLARGPRSRVRSHGFNRGITPACAGTTCSGGLLLV